MILYKLFHLLFLLVARKVFGTYIFFLAKIKKYNYDGSQKFTNILHRVSCILHYNFVYMVKFQQRQLFSYFVPSFCYFINKPSKMKHTSIIK